MIQVINTLKSGFLKISIVVLLYNYPAKPVYSFETDTLFRSDEIINIQLRSDFSAIEKNRTGNPEYFEGELIYYSPGGEPAKFNVRVMVRGHFRRDPEICSFPPLLVNFREKEVRNTLFDNQDKLKLVTPCQDDKDVVEEYLVYKMYNQVTDLSMKVRLAKITYYDTGGGKKLFEKYSFFVEDRDHVAKRNKAAVKDRFLTPFDLNRENFKKMAVFEYIIGNKDWHITSRKNVIIMQPEDPSIGLVVVPYDFDLSGLVNVDYSKPEGVPEYLLKDKRIYKGLCYTNDEFKDTFEFFRKMKPVFESVIDNQELISKYDKKYIVRYIDRFYEVIEDEDLFRREFLNACHTRQDYNLSDV
jgi:hypothetical protein